MHGMEHVVKEMAESLIRGVRRRVSGLPPDDCAHVLEQLKIRGCATIGNFWPNERCRQVIEEIDHALKTNTSCHRWTDTEGADRRLYFAERGGAELSNFFHEPVIESMRRHHSGVARADTLLLAARLGYVPGNKGSGGGWHRDSPHRSQFKAILYLTDVGLENGPFEYLEGTHLTSKSLRLFFNGSTRANQYRFSDAEAERIYLGGTVNRRTFTAEAGTLILVDTKGIHRGRPIERGCRYALTQYCFDGERPRDFLP